MKELFWVSAYFVVTVSEGCTIPYRRDGFFKAFKSPRKKHEKTT